jgi:hypothetical protein
MVSAGRYTCSAPTDTETRIEVAQLVAAPRTGTRAANAPHIHAEQHAASSCSAIIVDRRSQFFDNVALTTLRSTLICG